MSDIDDINKAYASTETPWPYGKKTEHVPPEEDDMLDFSAMRIEFNKVGLCRILVNGHPVGLVQSLSVRASANEPVAAVELGMVNYSEFTQERINAIRTLPFVHVAETSVEELKEEVQKMIIPYKQHTYQLLGKTLYSDVELSPEKLEELAPQYARIMQLIEKEDKPVGNLSYFNGVLHATTKPEFMGKVEIKK